MESRNRNVQFVLLRGEETSVQDAFVFAVVTGRDLMEGCGK